MKKTIIVTLVAAFLCVITNVEAIDRRAAMIDTLGYEATSFDGGDSSLFSLWGETVFAVPTEDSAILVGGGFGSISPSDVDDADFWTVGLGLKYYITHYTSLALIGGFASYDQDVDDDASQRSGTLLFKHRFISATEAVSPFVTVSVTGQSADSLKEDTVVATDTGAIVTRREYHLPELIAAIGAGCDFMLTETLAIVFRVEGFRSEEDISKGSSISDGWGARGSLAVTGYWDSN